MNNVGHIPAVQTTLGDLAARLSGLEAMIAGQVENHEEYAPGYVNVNRRFMYAALHFCTMTYGQICDEVRELLGGGPFQMPADISVVKDPEMRETFETYWSVPGQSAIERMKVLKLAWGPAGLGIRRPSRAVREVLCRPRLPGFRLQLPASAVGRVRDGPRRDDEPLRRPRGLARGRRLSGRAVSILGRRNASLRRVVHRTRRGQARAGLSP